MVGAVVGAVVGTAVGIAAAAACIAAGIFALLCLLLAFLLAALITAIIAEVGEYIGKAIGAAVDAANNPPEIIPNTAEKGKCVIFSGNWVTDRDHGWNELHDIKGAVVIDNPNGTALSNWNKWFPQETEFKLNLPVSPVTEPAKSAMDGTPLPSGTP